MTTPWRPPPPTRPFRPLPCEICTDLGHTNNASTHVTFLCRIYLRARKKIDEEREARYSKPAPIPKPVVCESAGFANAFSASASTASDEWIPDTGATSTMTSRLDWMRDLKPHRVPIRLGDNSVVWSEGIGNILFQPTGGSTTEPESLVNFSRVLYVPALRSNLLSVLYLTRHR